MTVSTFSTWTNSPFSTSNSKTKASDLLHPVDGNPLAITASCVHLYDDQEMHYHKDKFGFGRRLTSSACQHVRGLPQWSLQRLSIINKQSNFIRHIWLISDIYTQHSHFASFTLHFVVLDLYTLHIQLPNSVTIETIEILLS